jgi:RNA polymerase sigma factor (sigma-70 family)
MVEENLKLAYHFARFYRVASTSGHTLEDIQQVAVLGLCKAANKFDLDKGVQFSSFASLFIKGEIQHYLRDNKLIRTREGLIPVVSLDIPTKDGASYLEALPSPSDPYQDLRLVVDSLPKHLARLIKLVYFEEKTRQEAAKVLNCHSCTITRWEKIALKLLRERYE